MPAWNPLAPGVLGLEWWPTVAKTHPIAQSQPSLAFRVPSLAAETIGSLRLAVASNPAVTSRMFSIIDIVPAGSEEPSSAMQVTEYAPNADAVTGGWTTQAGGTTNLFATIDETVVYPPSGSDYIRQIVNGTGAYRCEVATAGFPSTARVLRVSIRAVIGVVDLGYSTFVDLGLFHPGTSTIHRPPSGIVYTNGLTPNYVLTLDCGEINPQTLLPWTPADIQSFDTGTWHIRVAGTGDGSNGPIVTAMALRVSYVDPENRVAAATWRRPAGAVSSPITTDALVTLPSGAANWSKANGVTYTYLPRWARDRLVGGSAPVANDIAWRAAQQDLGSGGSPAGLSLPPGGFVSSVLATTEHGLPTGPFLSESFVIPRLVIRTSAPADSADSQAYLNDKSSTVLRGLVSGTPIGQRITPGATRTYLGVRAVIAPPPSADGTLTIRVIRVSDSVQMGGTFTITADEVRALPGITGSALSTASNDFRYLQGMLSSGAALVSGTQYEARFEVSAGTWQALVPSAVGAGGVSLGGTTDFARIGGTSATEQDVAILLLEQPTAPATVTTEVVAQPQSGDSCFCTVDEIDQILVDWAGTGLGGSFARYEIERDENDGRGFLPVWHVNSAESVTFWTDYEMPMDRPVRYRVRVVSTSTAFSEWTYSGWVTAGSRGAEVVLTSNHAPELQLVYEREPQVRARFRSHDADELVPIHGADYQVAFFEPENRGITNTFTLTANFGRQPYDGLARRINLDEVWAPLIAIIRSTDVPYVCVRHPNGTRTFASVEMGEGTNAEPGWRYSVPLSVTPVTGVPTVGES